MPENVNIVGFSMFSLGAGAQRTKFQIAEYLAEWAAEAHVSWYAFEIESDTYDTEIPLLVKTVPINRGIRGLIPALVSSYKKRNEVFLMAYPAALRFFPWMIFFKIKYFIYIGNNYFEDTEFQNRGFGSRMKFRAQRAATNALVKYSVGTIARGKKIAKYLSAKNSNTIITHPLIHSVLNPDGYKIKKNIPEKYALYVGGLNVEKGFSVIIDAYREAKKLGINCMSLVAVGIGPLKPVSSEWPEIHCVGYIDDPDQLNFFYRNAVRLIVPSVNREGVPRVIDEALSHGVPVWATPQETITEEFLNEINFLESCPPRASDIIKLISNTSINEKITTRNNVGARGAARQHREFVFLGEKN